ncbi:P-loop containing nucleoside triphosphate hydrolase protein [Tothia fuscella]|uniref:P-loop containing nucleoside triphosphate hydrolase protein n=1 Tax=Tothia fuscella TaxID=1048955 RepID=A0A9P4TY12_9PEZI|nr:P-loop containing nucleoside triphosphate hydrolase protein [Tothia fuscella]
MAGSIAEKGERKRWWKKEHGKDTDNTKNGDKVEGKEAPPAPANFANFIRVLKFGTKFDWLLMGACTLTAIVSGVTMPLMFLVFGNLVGGFAGYFTPGSGVTKQEFQHSVNQQTLYIVYLFIARFVCSYISMFTVRLSGLRISSALRSAYLRALFAQPIRVIDTISPGKISSRITSSANTIQLGISQQLAMCIQALAFMIGLYVVSFVKSWLLTFVASASLPVILIVYGSVVPFFIKNHKAAEAAHEQASSLAFEIFSSIRIIVAFGAEGRLSFRHSEFLRKAEKSELKNAPLMGIIFAPVFFATYATFSLTFWFGIRQYNHGHLSGVGPIVTVLFSVVMAVTSIGRLASPIISMAKAATAASELLGTIDAERPDLSGLKAPEISAKEDISFTNVSFAYPSRPDVTVLDHLDLKFEAGNVTAIVGPSGSGKSTTVALLERWYDLHNDNAVTGIREDSGTLKEATGAPIAIEIADEKVPSADSGSIVVGKTNIREVDAKWWRAQIGLVQQEPFLFNDTIYQNVAYGLSGTEWQDVSEEEKLKMVQVACQEAYADEFITKLPQGYETTVGESGIKLSGGQRQRLAIARSIVKQPSILILDEATSAIDVRTERIVQKALDRVSKNRTTIVIAHRLSTIKKADKIIVLRKGKLVEQGTHEELLQYEDGIYHGLVRAQSLSMGHEELDDDAIVLDDEGTKDPEKVSKDEETSIRPVSVTSASDAPPDVKYKDKGFFESFGLIIREQRSHWLLYCVVIIGAIGGGAVYPIQAYLFAKIIETFTLTGQALVDKGNFWSLMFFVQALGVFVAYYILGSGAHQISTKISAFYREQYLDNILRKRVVFFDSEGHSAGTLTSNLTSDPSQVEKLTGGEMSMSYISIFNILGSLIISFVFGWKLSLLGVFTIMPIILVAGYFRVSLEMQFEKMNAAVFADSSQFATEAISAYRTVTSLIMEDSITNRYDLLLSEHVSAAFKKARLATLVFALSDSIEMLCQALCFWFGGRLMASREYNITQFFVIYMAVIQGSQAAGVWFSFAPNVAQAAAGANRILGSRFNDSETSHDESKSKLPSDDIVGIEFRDVHFSYKSRSVPVLTGLNISIKPGQFAALVGATGCGKSTVISLLERFYDADSGTILYGDTDVKDLNVKAYRENISLVAQESTLYEGTIKENVSVSVETNSVSDEAIEQACKEAQIHDFITSLPDGYSTQLGPKGVSVSGGQRQRLALARALLRRPRILLLDEATSSLDSESEKLVQEAIEKLATEGNRTVIAVAHRLATIQKADVIFVLGSGKVLEQGDHQALLKARGVYYSMCQAQALDR